MRKIVISFLMLFLICGLISYSYADPTYINTLPYTINQSGYYILNVSNLSVATPNYKGAITITASNVLVNGNGNTIRSSSDPTSSYTYGIYSIGCNNITVKNMNISYFTYGIEFFVSNSTIDNITLDNNYKGIYISGTSSSKSPNNIIKNINITSSSNPITYMGIYVGNLENNSLYNISISGFEYGLNIVNSNNVKVVNLSTYKPADTTGYSVVVRSGYNVSIYNSSMVDSFYGIRDDNSKNDSIYNTTISNALMGVIIYASNGTIVKNNTFYNINKTMLVSTSTGTYILEDSGSGVDVKYSLNSTISHNKFINNRYGVWMNNSFNNVIANNILYNNSVDAMFINSSNYNTIINNYLNELNKISNGIRLYNSAYNNIEYSNISNSNYGIILGTNSSYNKISFINSSNNLEGIFLNSSNCNNILNNILANNDVGITINNAYNNTITNTNISGNTIGISIIDSSNNTIYLNNFVSQNSITNNFVNQNILINPITDTSNRFYSPTKITYIYNGKAFTNYLGNYYSDYTGTDSDGDGIGDSPYIVNLNNNDSYPLIATSENYIIDNESPTVSINTPENKSYLVYHTPKINATVKDNYKVDSVIAEIHYANGTIENITLSKVNGTNDYVNASEINISTLGNYLIKIYANDTSGNLNNTENVSFTVIDNESPTVSINTPENKSYLVYHTPKINATVKDNYKVDSVIAEIHYANGTITNITLSNVNGTNDYVNTTTLNFSTLGSYLIKIYANDTSGNLNNTENVSFTVIDNESPTVSINTPENKSYLVYHTPKINATVKDNYKVDSVMAEIHYANGTITNITLSNVNGTNDYVNTTTLNFSTLGSYLIKIYANDTSGNLNNTENVSFTVIDNESPTVSINTPENKSYLIGNIPEINTTVKDNYKVDSVMAEIHYANGTIENITLSKVNGTNDYTNNITLNYPVGTNTIVILANDTSGNIATKEVSFKIYKNTVIVYHHSDNNHHNSYSFPEVSSDIKVYRMREHIHSSNVIAGSSVDYNYAKELKDSVEYANSSENITQDVILIGGSVANPLTNKYMNKFPVNITNKYPGKNIGVIQKTTMMVKKENNIYANISLILLAGSDRYGTKAAVEYFKTLDDIPDEPVYVQWKDGKVVKIEKP